MLSDNWLSRYRLLENLRKFDGNANAYDHGDYNSSFALPAVKLINGLQILMNLNLNSLLLKRQIDNPSPGAVTGGN